MTKRHTMQPRLTTTFSLWFDREPSLRRAIQFRAGSAASQIRQSPGMANTVQGMLLESRNGQSPSASSLPSLDCLGSHDTSKDNEMTMKNVLKCLTVACLLAVTSSVSWAADGSSDRVDPQFRQQIGRAHV